MKVHLTRLMRVLCILKFIPENETKKYLPNPSVFKVSYGTDELSSSTLANLTLVLDADTGTFPPMISLDWKVLQEERKL